MRPPKDLAELRRLPAARLSAFLRSDARGRATLRDLISTLHELGLEPYVFGGLIRDLVAVGGRVAPRDVDIVVCGGSASTLEAAVEQYIVRRTRFGGFRLAVGGWRCDVWLLGETWAFKNGLIPFDGVASLPKTTFLNVEAIAVQGVRPARGNRHTFEHGFAEGVRDRCVELNLAENPFPLLSVVRAMLTAVKLGFAIGSRLQSYIASHTANIDIEELLSAQTSHYGFVSRHKDQLQQWLKAVHRNIDSDKTQPLRLEASRGVQLELWKSTKDDGVQEPVVNAHPNNATSGRDKIQRVSNSGDQRELIPQVLAFRPKSTTKAKHVLLVVESHEIAIVAGKALQRKGYRVSAAMRGETSLGVVRTDPPDVMVVDLRMADMRGDALFELAAAMQPSLRHRTLFLIDSADHRGIELVAACRCDALTKPFDLDSLAQWVRNVTSSAQGAAIA